MEKWINADAVNKALDRIREEAWLHDIPSPTVPEYIKHHDSIQQIMLVIDKERKLLSDAADVAPVRHGEWIYADDCDSLYDSYWCNNCHHGITVDAERRCDIGFVVEDLKFCPHCGAKMDGGDGDD